ncbi:helix-turn-helix domain-containing protein [Bradyrhizobium zhanjiangense]|uniref:helix-turn-helix domain-containing protein n=1 Tax=Bradyrhizobium zhanjiangense TaxID=1325107 RepID=UPI003D30F8C9
MLSHCQCLAETSRITCLTIETVSRAVSQLHNDGVLAFVCNTQRRIIILDRQRLASFDLQR